MENIYETREQILLILSNYLFYLYNPKPNSNLDDFEKLKKSYYDLKEGWLKLNGITEEIFNPFQLEEIHFNRIRPIFELNKELIRNDETGEPSYNQLSANYFYNLPQRRRKKKIVKLALGSQGVSFKKLFP